MQNKSLATMVFFVLVMVFTAGICGAQEKVYDLKMQDCMPPDINQKYKQFASNIETMSNGRVKIAFFSSGQLVPMTESMNALRSGMIDIAHSIGSAFTEMNIGLTEQGLPMAWQNAMEAELLYEELGFKEIVADEYEKAGVHYLSQLYSVPMGLLSKKPVKTLDDLKGMKVRVSGGFARLLKNVGAAATHIPWEDIYIGLSTGQIDGVIAGCGPEYEIFKWNEAAKYYLSNPFISPIVDHILVSQKLWNSLPDDLKLVFEAAARILRWEYHNVMYLEEVEFQTKQRHTEFMTTLRQEEFNKLMSAANEVWEVEAKKSPANAKAVAAIRKLNKLMGRSE
jgi:TRAP-type C4-dicarboxylate transport system substrate-binding protein